MSSARFNDTFVILFEFLKCGNKSINGRNNLILNSQNSGNAHGCRECIVRGLRHINIIIWVKNLLTCNFVTPVCDNLVCVHI